MSLIRKYKISQLLNKPLISDKEKEIIELIKYWTDNLVQITYIDDKFETFFYKNDKIFIIAETNNYKVRVRYEGFIEILMKKFQFNQEEVIELMEDMLNHIIKIKYQVIVDLDKARLQYAEILYNELSKEI